MRDKPYCKAPWIGLVYESNVGCKPCCEYMGGDVGINPASFMGRYEDYKDSAWLKNFKAMMYLPTMNPGCKICIDQEEANKKLNEYGDRLSRRQKFDRFDVDFHGENKIKRFDYRPGNKCNLSCRMCHPEASSLREEEEIALGRRDKIFKVEDMSDAYSIDLNECENLMILGGEPSIDLEVRKWIDHVKNYDMIIGITTNATNASDKWFDSIDQIKRLDLVLSIDGTGKTQDFQRKGSDWNLVKRNIMKYKERFQKRDHTFLNIAVTASAINFPIIDQWWEEMMALDIPIFFSQVNEPKHYSLKAIPSIFKEDMIEYLEDWKIKNPASDMSMAQKMNWNSNSNTRARQLLEAEECIVLLERNDFDKATHDEFIKEINVMDAWRKESIIDLDNRFEEILNA